MLEKKRKEEEKEKEEKEEKKKKGKKNYLEIFETQKNEMILFLIKKKRNFHICQKDVFTQKRMRYNIEKEDDFKKEV